MVQLSRKMMAFAGIQLKRTASGFEYFYSFSVNWLIYIIFIYTVIFSYQFIVSHFDQTESILYAGMQLAANIPLSCSYWSLSRAKFKINDFLHDLENLINERMDFSHFNRYEFII